MGIIRDGITMLTTGILIIGSIPHVVAETVFEKIGNKKEKKEIKVTVNEVDINKLPKESQDWIRRCYDKKNGENK